MENQDKTMKAIVVGAGFAGAVIARQLAEAGWQVVVLDRRNTIAGNMFDFIDDNGILCHLYGPHLFRTDSEAVWAYISRFGRWYEYVNYTGVSIDGHHVYMPFNFNAIEVLLGPAYLQKVEGVLVQEFGREANVPVLDMLNSPNRLIREIAQFFYEKDYLPYTMKQWGLGPKEIDPSVTARVPIRIGRDNRLSTVKYQAMPLGGYISLFEDILAHDGIEVRLNDDAFHHLRLDPDRHGLEWDGCPFPGLLVYTGAIDELLGYRFGRLQYRSLDFEFESVGRDYFQETLGVCYPDPRVDYTRIIEYKHLMAEKPRTQATTIVREYPKNCGEQDIPYYPMITDEAWAAYRTYRDALSAVPNLVLVGRLAEYKYYNMDDVIARALAVADEILHGGRGAALPANQEVHR